jgi:thiosulfate/3-mercaptopyruvate sulfurtransferase
VYKALVIDVGTARAMREYTQIISVAKLQENLGSPALRILDCRFDLMRPQQGRIDYGAGHIPGAQYVDLDRDLAAPVRDDTGRHPLPELASFVERIRELGISNDTQIVAYDGGSGALAARAWWLVRWLGHPAVAVLDGGLNAWRTANAPLTTLVPRHARGDFSGQTHDNWVVSSDEVTSRMRGAAMLPLVDARDADRFAGNAEPIDPVAGHIPGALNFPFAQNLGEDGLWRDSGELRARWQALFGDSLPDEWAVMCGSGVTACHLVLSAELAGLPWPRLYAGSWSEWIRNAERPVEPPIARPQP